MIHWSEVFNCTCNMLRLHGACLFNEGVLAFKCEDGFVGNGLRLVPCSISGVALIRQMNDISPNG